jgi:sigma-E factor negative regulatory protein RseA
MNDQNREQISALMDDELSTQEAHDTLLRLQQDEELQQKWSRYHLIGDVMKGETPQVNSAEAAARISALIAEEPAIIAAPKRKPLLPQNSTWFRAVAGAGLAASVAALAVITAPYFMTPGSGDGMQLAEGSKAATSTYEKRSTARWKNLSEPAEQSRLNSYLVEHGEYVSPGGVGGTAPYATFVDYDADK